MVVARYMGTGDIARGRHHAPNTVAFAIPSRRETNRTRREGSAHLGSLLSRAAIMIDWLRPAATADPRAPPETAIPDARDRRIRPWTLAGARVSVITNHCDFLDNRCIAVGEGEIIEDPDVRPRSAPGRDWWPTLHKTLAYVRLPCNAA